MAFIKVGSLDPHGAPILRKQIITNSEATIVGYSVKLVSGFATAGTTGALVFGHITAHEGQFGDVGMESTGATGATSGSYVGTFTVSSTNQTVAKVKAVCDISKHTLYSAEVDVAIGTTTGSNLAGYTQDIVDADTLDESTAVTTTGQYMGHGVDPENSAKAIVNIYESQVFGV